MTRRIPTLVRANRWIAGAWGVRVDSLRQRPSLLEASDALSDLGSRDAYLRAAPEWINRLIPGDDVFWMQSDFGAGVSRVWHGPDGTEDPTLGPLVAGAVDHPVIHSYLRNPVDRSPRRLCDVAPGRAWRATRAWELLEQLVGRHQLSMVVRLRPPLQGDAWIMGRERGEFSAAELRSAEGLLALLAALGHLYDRPPDAGPTPTGREAVARLHLTDREVDILSLVSRGLTADAIARCRRISPGTVRKHLQNAYAKLGVSDRLMAVDRARRLGILTTPPPGDG
jgi:DNA-binding CsgD family transcriptional regulator